jgi:branched-chain amino acid transport system permease protein
MDQQTAMYVSQAIHGIAYGMVLFLVASGLTMIFGMMDILNLAHAAFFMLSAYFCYQFLTLTGSFWAALLLAPLATAFFGIILERFFLRKLHGFGLMSQLVLTVGVTLVILASVKIFWGTESLPVKVPPVLSGLIKTGGLDYPIYRVFVIVLSLLVLAIMALLLFKTRLGKIVRAAVSDSDMVNALGINVPLVSTTVFGVGIWLAGVAGVAIAPILTVFPGLEAQMGMDAFVVVITGGFGSLGGAFLVSIIFGLLSSFGVQFVSTLAPVLMFAFMAIVLAIKPTGLFGERE